MKFSELFLFLFGTALIYPTAPLPYDISLDSSRVVNGFEIDIKEIPYHTALRRRVGSGWAYMCGGAIINERAVLTAAHCVTDFISTPSSLRVVVGSHYRLSGGKVYDVSKVYVHEFHDFDSFENDIALLVTSKSITFGSNVSPITIAPGVFNVPPGTQALVSGFGRTAEDGEISPILLAAYVQVTSQSACSRAYQPIGIAAGMICAAASSPPRDACQGDSGGPLVAYGYLIGIVSWGEGCAQTSYPGVYTRVSEYEAWIGDKIERIDFKK